MDLMEAMKGRRSIRKYKSDPVPEEVLQQLLETVRWAPSWANTQCCELVIVKDPTIKAEIASTLSKGNPATTSMTVAPLVLVFCAKKGVSGYYSGKMSTVKGDWLMFDSGLAMQNFALAAHAQGLGTVIVGLFDHKKVEEILGVPENIEVVAMTPLGYRATEGTAPKRKEIAEFVFYDRYPKKD
jgi:nitroreductase